MSALRHDRGKRTFHHIHPLVLKSRFGSWILCEEMVQWYFYRKDIPQSTLKTLIANEGMFKVLDFGAQKYASLNYAKGMSYSRVFNSWFRHMVDEENLDRESGLPHSWHAACNILFAITYNILGYDDGKFDDRPTLELPSKENKK